MKSTEHKSLLLKYQNKEISVGIIGLGYVGLPLMWTFHEAGLNVVGFDVDESKIQNIKKGIPYIKHLGSDMMMKLSSSDKIKATSDFSQLKEVDAVLICVPTPLDHHKEPDMSYVLETTTTISKYLRKKHLIILESTTWPGTTEELMVPILEENSNLKSGRDFFVAYSPEREDPGNKNFNTAKIPKVVGGHGDNALELALTLYNTAIERTIPVSNCKTAEATKLTENIFRAVNIALVNELKVVYQKMGIDVHEVLEAADSKPFGFMKFTPGPGLGGHCIPIDPYYLTWKAKEFDINSKFIELAGQTNDEMPYYVLNRISYALNMNKKSINGSKILVLGLAYKADIDDMRESPSFKVMQLLREMGGYVSYFDPFIDIIGPNREYPDWEGMKSISWNARNIRENDAVVIITNHSNINYNELVQWSNCIIDSRNVIDIKNIKNGQVLIKA